MSDNHANSRHVSVKPITPNISTSSSKEIKRLKGVIATLVQRLKFQDIYAENLKEDNVLLRESLENVKETCSESLHKSEEIFEKMKADIEDGLTHKRRKG